MGKAEIHLHGGKGITDEGRGPELASGLNSATEENDSDFWMKNS